MSAYWSMDSFGSVLPENWEEIVEAANAIIAEHIAMNDLDEDEAEGFSEDLWDSFCETGEVGAAAAVYRLEDLDPVEVIETVTGTRHSAEIAVRNGAGSELYTPEEFAEVLRSAAGEDDTTDYAKALEQAKAGELRMDGAHNGIYHGTPFVWFHG